MRGLPPPIWIRLTLGRPLRQAPTAHRGRQGTLFGTRSWTGRFLHRLFSLLGEESFRSPLEAGPGAGQVHQGLVRPPAFGPGRSLIRAQLLISAVRIENPCLATVVQADIEDLPQTLFGPCGEDGSDDLDPFREIA